MRCRKQIVAWGLVICMVICTGIWHISGIKVKAETINTLIMNNSSSQGPVNETTNATTTHVKDYNEAVEGFYLDYNYTQPASKGAIEIYANGTKNYKSDVLYTDITPCYVYTEEKGKIKTSTSKIIAAVTASDKEPAISKSKITTTKADTDIAKATIKNGQITVTAGKNGGIGYLWVANVTAPDKAKKMISIPVNVKVAPTKIEIYNRADKNVTLGTTEKYTAGELQLIGRTYVYLYPYVKVNNVNTETIDSISFTATVAKNTTDYIRVEKTNDPFVFMVEGYALKNGKKVSGNVTFTCDQSGKKVNFKATVKDMILDFTYQPKDSTKLVQTTADSTMAAYKVIGVSIAAITTKLDVKNRTFFERGRETYGVLPTTDNVYLTKISKDTATALSKNVRSYDDANDGIDVPLKKNGKPDVTADTTKGVTASYSKGVITVKVAKKTEVGTTAYFLLSTNSGYGEIIAVTTAEK